MMQSGDMIIMFG